MKLYYWLGRPDPDKINTSYVERFNLSARMASRRFTRLTNAHSKRLANHRAAVALWIAFYNFCRVHETLRCTPALALGVTGHIWSIADAYQRGLGANRRAAAPERAEDDAAARLHTVQADRHSRRKDEPEALTAKVEFDVHIKGDRWRIVDCAGRQRAEAVEVLILASCTAARSHSRKDEPIEHSHYVY